MTFAVATALTLPAADNFNDNASVSALVAFAAETVIVPDVDGFVFGVVSVVFGVVCVVLAVVGVVVDVVGGGGGGAGEPTVTCAEACAD